MTKKTGWEQLKPNARTGADVIVARFNPSLAGGWRPGPAGRPHPSGRAVDFMSYSNTPLGEAMALFAVANREGLGNVNNVIWNRRISSARSNPPWSWRTYPGPNPHTDHVHVEWSETGSAGPIIDDVGDEDDAGGTNPIDAFKQFLQQASDPNSYIRIGLFFGGLTLIIIGLFRFAFVQNAIKAAGKVAKNAR